MTYQDTSSSLPDLVVTGDIVVPSSVEDLETGYYYYFLFFTLELPSFDGN